MGAGMNKVMLLGNLGADPDLRYTQNGTAVLHFRMATSESYIDKNKELQERTEWHNVVIWGNRGEALAKHLSKGDGVLVEGSLRTSSYEKDGIKRYRTEVLVSDLCFTGRSGKREEGSEDPVTGQGSKGRNGSGGRKAELSHADDMPF